MKTNITNQIEVWINDQLDLYNYALQIGDTDWQQQILDTLSQKDKYLQELYNEQENQRLWGQFNEINQAMLQLLEEIRTQALDREQLEAIRVKLSELKKRRLTIVHKINSVKVTPSSN
ncbi:hypothetical protein DFQ01_1373 [Paenibacillus cellulosilyticus]|uniref:Uncharacterized protein n=1 Tax=Paenibacillus cellulosilyticus TaxID=375489 RepID=A0A2V2YGK0_9BACL|nr:hypothetical protein [Paenibacillus cellulosilyticus]PWV92017.1 hypothetical protein DFQ01_1373 [Paenibacillus cellulosilyticus]QKS46699.1 hypothetical protein HUB94_19530 [Paenibacillus cellulosilyticus]